MASLVLRPWRWRLFVARKRLLTSSHLSTILC
jgi:hypothetical protein